MPEKLPTGLRWRSGVIHMKKRYLGIDIVGSCHTDIVADAEAILAREIEKIRHAKTFGQRPERLFKEAVLEYLERLEEKRRYNPNAYRSLHKIKQHLKVALTYLAEVGLHEIHDGHPQLKLLIRERKAQGLKNKTVNLTLEQVRRVLNLSTEWRDEWGLTWLDRAPKISTLDAQADKAEPYPLTWAQQEKLLAQFDDTSIVPDMALFMVNSGTRENEVCNLRWQWEVYVPELKTNIFILPGTITKNKKERIVVLNDTARAVIERHRGKHSEFVFIQRHGRYAGLPQQRMRKRAWCSAWKAAGLPVSSDTRHGVHNLKHTFGRRLAAAGCPWYERKVLLGHTVADVTDLYSPAQIENLLRWAKTVDKERKELTMVRRIRLAQ